MSRKRRWLSCFVKLVRVTNALWAGQLYVGLLIWPNDCILC